VAAALLADRGRGVAPDRRPAGPVAGLAVDRWRETARRDALR
jgi:hypothetical protein